MILAVFCWRGIPAAGFWTGADSLYTLRADVQSRANTMNTVLDWPDRVLVISQGDDATRWYYYRYELTAQVVNGFGGFLRPSGRDKGPLGQRFYESGRERKLDAVRLQGRLRA